MFCLVYLLAWSLAAASPATRPAAIEINGTKLTVRTATVEADFDGPILRGVRPAGSDVEFASPAAAGPGIDLLYLDGSLLNVDKHERVAVRRLSELAARVEVSGADTTRTLLVVTDPDTGDIRITPDGLSNRRALRAVRWTVPLHAECMVTLPCVNGLQFRVDQPHPPTNRFRWPCDWNAQLTVATRGAFSLMVHCEDRDYRYKALQLTRHGDRTEVGFESESPGPLWDNRTAGGIEWRLNVYKGDWRVPAERYKQWMATAYDLAEKRRHRPAWVTDISLAVCWAGTNPDMLDALAAAHPPSQTLIHLSGWRTDKYDVNYPEYIPSEQAIAYMAKARDMGFHVMPHFNYFSVYYQHPFFQVVRDFQLRTIDKNQPDGWHWPPETHDYTRMGFIHPGLGVWRDKLIDVVGEVCGRTSTDVTFLDQTLCTWNADNASVQGMNTIAALHVLQEQFAAVYPELVLAGEGLTEISFQRQCFAQAHILEGWGDLAQKHVEAQHDICQFLWGDHTRLIGYYHLTPGGKQFDKGIETYERMRAIPTLITNNPADLREPDPLTRRVLELARRPRITRAGD
ncbi:MAG: hypothetical protein GXY55_10530 [Phycisphaerae bacterium]|nr:hypothetical protein [Phycisphaerae bacterium]